MGFKRFLASPLSNTNPPRPTEVYAVYRVESMRNIINQVTKGSVKFNKQELMCFLLEREALIFGFDNQDTPIIISDIMGISVKKVERILDMVEAKCFVREFMGLDPVPPFKYPINNFDNFWDIFFEDLVI